MAKIQICRDCEVEFELPVQRGRPAVRCLPCRSKTPTVMQFARVSTAGTKETVELKMETIDGVVWIENSEPCESCNKVFMRPRKRGRPPVRCAECQEGLNAAKAAEMTVSEETLEQLFQGDKTLLQGTPGERPKGAEAQCPTTGKCGRIFTSNTACDDHKQWLPNGSYKCIDPATLGMEPRGRVRDADKPEERIVPVWTRPTIKEVDV